MGDYKVKVIATLSVDNKKETDLLDFINNLRDRHKLGEFVTAAMRVCWEHPEYLEGSGYVSDTRGMTQERTKFIRDISEQITVLHRRVDKMYEMVYQLKVLALMNKRLGLEQRVENSMRAIFILQRQIDELGNLLGVNSMQPAWVNDTLENEYKKAEATLETIITAYDGIVSELRGCVQEGMVPRVSASPEQLNIKQAKIEHVSIEQAVGIKAEEVHKESNTEEQIKEEAVEPDDTADMSNADWDALAMFVGEGC